MQNEELEHPRRCYKIYGQIPLNSTRSLIFLNKVEMPECKILQMNTEQTAKNEELQKFYPEFPQFTDSAKFSVVDIIVKITSQSIRSW